MSRDSEENQTIGNLYSENVLAVGMVSVDPVEEAHPVDGDAGSLARGEINDLKEQIHNWVETDATEDELRQVIDRINEVEDGPPIDDEFDMAGQAGLGEDL